MVKYIINILSALTPNVATLRTEIFSLLNSTKKYNNFQEVDKSILTLINTSKKLLKQFDDQIITKEILLLSNSNLVR